MKERADLGNISIEVVACNVLTYRFAFDRNADFGTQLARIWAGSCLLEVICDRSRFPPARFVFDE